MTDEAPSAGLMSHEDFGLTFATPKPAATRNILLYGPGGSGKTVNTVGTAPGPVLYLNAEGSGAIDYTRRHYPAQDIRELTISKANAKATLAGVMRYLRAGADGARTVVVDSVPEVFKALLKESAGTNKVDFTHYSEAGPALEDFLRFLRDEPFHVVLIAHEATERNETTGEMVWRPYTGTNKPTLANSLVYAADIVGYCGVVGGATEDDPPRYVGQLVPAKGRTCKDRSGRLGAVRTLDIGEWIATSLSSAED